MKKTKKLLALVIAVVLIFANIIPVFAFDASSREGVAIIQLWFQGKSGKKQTNEFEEMFAWGTCFFVGEKGKDPQYLITNFHVVSDYYESGAGKLGWYTFTLNGEEVYAYGRAKMRVYYDSKTYDEAYPVEVNKTDDVAVFKLDKPTSKRKPLTLQSPKEDMVGSTCYAVGFPGLSENTFADSTSMWSATDATVTKGAISRLLTTEGTGTRNIQIDCDIKHGNSGGPLMTETSNVIGINTWGTTDSSNGDVEEVNYAINIDTAITLLKRNGIEYDDADKVVTTTKAPTPDDNKKKNDESKLSTAAIIGIVAAVVVAAAAVVVVIVVLSKKGKSSNAPAASPAQQGGAVSRPPAGSEGTTLLSGNMNTVANSGACLINLSTNERVAITKPYFKIGKDASRVDYCVKNPAVSRFHASIVTKGNQYYLIDNATTNHTYVNGSMISPNVEIRIFNGAKITLADEKFEFRI
ncbi:MAG: trypsin-like peptidase domain-containing protein [Clostridia bacterium]|nr:trypsin-like peptidase domain-containing protein [Clostridia bacterium]